MFYADETKLSSLGTAKGYPFMGKVVNLDADLYNGNGPAGAQIFGWLPVVRNYIMYIYFVSITLFLDC